MAKIIPFPIERMKDRVITKSVMDRFIPQDIIGICGWCQRSFGMRITYNEKDQIEEFIEDTGRQPLCPECSANPLIAGGDVIIMFDFNFIKK